MNRSAFFDAARPIFFKGRVRSPVQVTRLSAVLEALDERRVPIDHAAYILATAFHESDQFRTMEEYASGTAYERRADLGNTEAGDGKRFKGRGLVQITGRRNYADWSGRLGVDLIAKPELAADLHYAVPILIEGMLEGSFTGKKLGDYRTWRAMRRIVNGMDKADKIAGHAADFRAALEAAGYLQDATAPEKEIPKTPPPAEPAVPAKSGFGAVLSAILSILKAIFKRSKT